MSSTRQPERRPGAPGARRAFAVLAAAMLALTVINIGFTVIWVGKSDHAWCSILGAATATPVPKPADPVKTPAQENNYQWYERFTVVSRDLGC